MNFGGVFIKATVFHLVVSAALGLFSIAESMDSYYHTHHDETPTLWKVFKVWNCGYYYAAGKMDAAQPLPVIMPSGEVTNAPSASQQYDYRVKKIGFFVAWAAVVGFVFALIFGRR